MTDADAHEPATSIPADLGLQALAAIRDNLASLADAAATIAAALRANALALDALLRSHAEPQASPPPAAKGMT